MYVTLTGESSGRSPKDNHHAPAMVGVHCRTCVRSPCSKTASTTKRNATRSGPAPQPRKAGLSEDRGYLDSMSRDLPNVQDRVPFEIPNVRMGLGCQIFMGN